MFGIAIVIMSAFFAIRLLHISVPDSATNAGIAILVSASFLGIYDKAYLVESGIGQLAREILVQSPKLQSSQARAEMRRAIKTVRDEGVVIGGF